MASRRDVGIIGAGMTGLCACKHLLDHGFQPTVLEARDCIGGIWRHTCTSTRLQTSKHAYQFSDFPWPPGTPLNPKNDEVVSYLESYADAFHLKSHIRFNCMVTEIQSVRAAAISSDLWGDNGQAFAKSTHGEKVWRVRVRTGTTEEDAKTECLSFDFLVLCVGRYGHSAVYPRFPPKYKGPETFYGTVLHSLQYGMLDNEAARQLVTGQRVVVVGSMKSAIDIAMEASDFNQGISGRPCHLLFRSPNWVFVNQMPFPKLIAYLYFTRFSELLNFKPGQSWWLHALSTCFAPLRWFRSKLAELYLCHILPLRKYGLIPKHSFSEYAMSCKLFVLPELFFPRVEKGEIVLHKTVEWGFSERGVVLGDGTQITADVVILGTGYDINSKLLSMFSKDYASLLQDDSGVIPLYRGTIHPRIPHLAILGYQIKFSHLQSSEMCARWLAYFLSGRFLLPSVQEMETDAQAWVTNMKRVSPFFKQACIGAAQIWHSDKLCRDMGWNHHRKSGWFQEWFSPYSNMDYKD